MGSCMNQQPPRSKVAIFCLASRPKFLTASAAPVLVGSALGFAVTGSFNTVLFVLALLAIMALHAGANIANDYFDHTSKNDWLNQNPTPFSGGRRYIQNGTLSPKATLLAAFSALAIGSTIGIIIVLLTRSLFILILGILGTIGGYFYTASPIRLGYRGIGELVIMLLFGVLPVYGSYYLQTGTIDTFVLFPAVLVGVLIFLVILVNEFPDMPADAAVNKNTLVVHFGPAVCAWIYRIALIASYVIAVIALLVYHSMFWAALFYLFTLPSALILIKFANKKELTTPGLFRANQLTILLHTIGCLALAAGFVVSALRS